MYIAGVLACLHLPLLDMANDLFVFRPTATTWRVVAPVYCADCAHCIATRARTRVWACGCECETMALFNGWLIWGAALKLCLCLLRLKSSTCSSHFNLEHRPTPTPLPIRAAMRNVRIKRMSRHFQIEHAGRRRDIWAGGR